MHNVKILSLSVITLYLLSGCGASTPITPKPITPQSIDIITTKEPIEVHQESFLLGDTPIDIVQYEKKPHAILYFRPHENETTSNVVTMKMLEKYGGRFVELKAQQERLIKFNSQEKHYIFDPNRIFSPQGVADTLKKYGSIDELSKLQVKDFAEHILSKFLNNNLIVAVHNNTQGEPLSIKSYLESKEALEVHINPSLDEDNFFYVTQKADFDALKSKNFNVILQDNNRVSDDGSMSVYCGVRGIRYINVEAQMGDESHQLEMLETLQTIL